MRNRSAATGRLDVGEGKETSLDGKRVGAGARCAGWHGRHDGDDFLPTFAVAHDVHHFQIAIDRQADAFELADDGGLALIGGALIALGTLTHSGEGRVELADAVGLAGLLADALGNFETDHFCFHGLTPVVRRATPVGIRQGWPFPVALGCLGGKSRQEARQQSNADAGCR